MNKFNSAASSTFKGSSTPFSIQYGTGSCAGDLANDTLGIGASGSGQPQVQNQVFGLATTVAAFFVNTSIDGIFGLGLKGLAVDGAVPPLDNMYAQGVVSQRLFGLYLNSSPAGSSIDLGYIDNSKFTGTLEYFPYKKFLFRYNYYLISFGGMSVGGQAVDITCLPFIGCEALLDSGTSLLIGPTGAIKDLTQKLGVKSDCSNMNNGPTWDVTVGSSTYSIPSNVYTLKDPDTGLCSPAIAEQALVPFWIFGDTFLRSVYAVYDNDNMQLGLAPQA
jgi:hypothetical protein